MSVDPRTGARGTPRLNAGDRTGPYVVLDLLGAGGMGEVYRARDTRLERDVALKRLSSSVLGSEEARSRILSEARAAAALSHPNIAAVFDVLETPDGLVIVMEYVPGESLAARIDRGPIPVDETLRLGAQIADALSDAHDHGVIHRDLKPANVHLTPFGKAKILDFGIARSLSDEYGAAEGDAGTEAGRIIGTPGYMAPEQLAGAHADQRTDIYGAGLLLFEMLTGRRPFNHADLIESARAILQGPPPRAGDLAPHVPPRVSDLVARAMALEPGDRFATARDLRGALEQATHDLSDAVTIDAGGGAPYGTRRPALPWPQRRAVRAGVAVLLLTAALGAASLLQRAWSPPVSAHPPAIAVLPVRNLSGDPQDDALAVGVTEALARRLASLKSVHVLSLAESREAAAAAPDPAGAVRTLGAQLAVEGGLARQGQTLELDLALVGTSGRRTPAGRYTGDVSDVFALHREAVEGLARALDEEGLAPGASKPDAASPTTNQDAFAEYAQARLFLERPDVPGSLGHAVRLFQSAIAKDSRFALAYAGLGQAYWALYGETNEAEWTVRATTAILDALRIDSDQPEVRLSLAVMYQGLGRRAEAEEELRRVIAAQPRNDNAYRLQARIHVDRGEWDLANAAGRTAIALRPDFWRNHAELGYANFRAGRLEEAAKAYERVTELQPDSARGFHNLGTVHQTAGNTAAALESYQRANQIRPAASTSSNIGTVLFWQGDYAGAAGAYEQAIGLSPNQPGLHANLGDALQQLGRRDEARRNYRRAIEEVSKLLAVNDTNALNLSVLAIYHAKLGEHEAAGRASEKALAISPRDGEVVYGRAIVHAQAGETAQACAALARALALGVSAAIVRQAYELKSLEGCPAYDKVAVR